LVFGINYWVFDIFKSQISFLISMSKKKVTNRMDFKKSGINIAPPKMKSFLIVQEDEKLVIKKLETELIELKQLVDRLVKFNNNKSIK
jgi:hypothetical protein